jgi:calcineurin-like phosphoesterase family protein
MTVFFISDTHFGDHRVLNLYPRPFASVAAMDAAMIARWNAAVGPEDEIWHLGDFARTTTRAAEILPRLNGRKHLVLGNNDPMPQPEGWASIANYAELQVDGSTSCSAITRFAAGRGWTEAASICMATATVA